MSAPVSKVNLNISQSHLWQAYASFRLALEAARRSPRTLEYYHDFLQPFLYWLERHEITDLAGIRPNHIRAFILEREQAGRAPLTVHHYAACIRAFCNFLVAEDLLTVSPMAKVKMPSVPQTILPAFTKDEIDKLLTAARDARDKAILLFMLDSGVRASELCALNWIDVNFQTGAVMVHLGKGGKDRITFIGARTRRALTKYLRERGKVNPGDPLFVLKGPDREYTPNRLTLSGLRAITRRLSEVTGLQCSPHKFRRSFALLSLRSGMDIYSLQAMMGHADLTILRRYLALTERDLEKSHRLHGPVDSTL